MGGNFEATDFLIVFKTAKEFKARLGKEKSRQEREDPYES
jgi:hypothetical protein